MIAISAIIVININQNSFLGLCRPLYKYFLAWLTMFQWWLWASFLAVVFSWLYFFEDDSLLMAIIGLVGVSLPSSLERLMLFFSVLGRDLLLDLC
jgi:hypothetical protein